MHTRRQHMFCEYYVPTADPQIHRKVMTGGALTTKHTERSAEDAEWIAPWIAEWGDVIARFALSYTHNRETAQDIAQETFWRLHQWHVAHPDHPIHGGWLYTTARRLIIDQQRTLASHTQHVPLHADIADMEPPMEEQLTRKIAVQQIIDTFPSVDQECLWLFYYQSWSIAEIAQTLQLSPSAVKTRLHRARQRFAHLWKEDEP